MLYESFVHWWPLAAIVILGIDGLGGGGRGNMPVRTGIWDGKHGGWY